MKCATDVLGNHVIRKALDLADDIIRSKLMSELVGNAVVSGKDE